MTTDTEIDMLRTRLQAAEERIDVTRQYLQTILTWFDSPEVDVRLGIKNIIGDLDAALSKGDPA